jgi:hypothetical protein
MMKEDSRQQLLHGNYWKWNGNRSHDILGMTIVELTQRSSILMIVNHTLEKKGGEILGSKP